MTDRNALRRELRARRRALPAPDAHRCAMDLARRLGKDPRIINSQHIACYLAADGELDLSPLMDTLWSLGKTVFLPVLVPFAENRLWFARFEPGDMLVVNRYGIPEPLRRRLLKPAALDVVLTPLVAFDARGHRLGMGGGYYDRCFAYLQRRQHWFKPKLIGIAYDFQRRHTLRAEPWDVALDAVATESHIYDTHRQV